MRITCTFVLTILITSNAVAQINVDALRKADTFLVYADLVARVQIRSLTKIYNSNKDYFNSRAPNDGARMLAEAAIAAVYAGDIAAAKTLIADPIMNVAGVSDSNKYLVKIIHWMIDKRAYPGRKTGCEKEFARGVVYRYLVMGDTDIRADLEFLNASYLNEPTQGIPLAAMKAAFSGSSEYPKRFILMNPEEIVWPSIEIPLQNSNAVIIRFYDPGFFVAVARAFVLYSSIPTTSYSRQLRTYLINDYDSLYAQGSASGGTDYSTLLWMITAEARRGNSWKSLTDQYVQLYGNNTKEMAIGAFYLSKYAHLPAVAANWLTIALEIGGATPLAMQIKSYHALKTGEYSLAHDYFTRYIQSILKAIGLENEEWAVYYCIDLFENGLSDPYKGTEQIKLLTKLMALPLGAWMDAAIKCVAQYYTCAVIIPTEIYYESEH